LHDGSDGGGSLVVADPRMRRYLAYDPKPVLRTATSALPAVTGSKDVQESPADIGTIEAITGNHTAAVVVDHVGNILRTEPALASNPKRYKHQVT
jgi:hypothetical protein